MIDTFLLHDSGSNCGHGDIARLRNRWRGASAHYVVDRDGSIYQLVADKDRAWLTGTTLDEHSIGIELVNDGSGQTLYPPPQYQALVELISELASKYSPLLGSGASPGTRSNGATRLVSSRCGIDIEHLCRKVRRVLAQRAAAEKRRVPGAQDMPAAEQALHSRKIDLGKSDPEPAPLPVGEDLTPSIGAEVRARY